MCTVRKQDFLKKKKKKKKSKKIVRKATKLNYFKRQSARGRSALLLFYLTTDFPGLASLSQPDGSFQLAITHGQPNSKRKGLTTGNIIAKNTKPSGINIGPRNIVIVINKTKIKYFTVLLQGKRALIFGNIFFIFLLLFFK